MSKAKLDRGAKFRAALALEKKTQEQWAAERKVTQGHLSQVLSGNRESERLWEQIDEYADKTLARITKQPAA